MVTKPLTRQDCSKKIDCVDKSIKSAIYVNMVDLNKYNHGRETYAVYYGDDFVLKRPLPNFTDEKKQEWLKKQHKTKEIISAVRAIGNPVYNVPAMRYVNDDEFQVLEERAPGEPLTRDLYNKLSGRQQFEIINAIGSFLVDMNESKPVTVVEKYKISKEIKFARLDSFIENKMNFWFTKNETQLMARIRDEIGNFEYETCQVWSHGDLNTGNVLYSPEKNKLSFIDFAEADYTFIYHDIFAPLNLELDIYKKVYLLYKNLHNKTLYHMPCANSETLRNIMKYRMIGVLLKRFIKASDDLRKNPINAKSMDNNLLKIAFMRKQMQNILLVEAQFTN